MNIQSSIPLRLDPRQSAEKDGQALKKACGEFESILVSQMLRKMRDSIPKSDLFGSREKEEMFQGMLDDEMARDLSTRGSLKLGELLYRQLSHNQTAKDSGEAVDR